MIQARQPGKFVWYSKRESNLKANYELNVSHFGIALREKTDSILEKNDKSVGLACSFFPCTLVLRVRFDCYKVQILLQEKTYNKINIRLVCHSSRITFT